MTPVQAKIIVEPEGRPGMWLADKASLKTYIKAQGWEAIHNFATTSLLMIGADHGVESVLADIDSASRVAVLTGDARRENLNHAMALIMPPDGLRPERLEMYDIGDVSEALAPEDTFCECGDHIDAHCDNSRFAEIGSVIGPCDSCDCADFEVPA